MSEEATSAVVKLTRRALEGSNPRDFDALMSFYAPGAVWDMSPVGMGIFEGVEAIRGFYEDWIGAYDDYRITVEESVDLGNEVAVSVLSQQARPAGSSGSLTRWRYGCVTAAADGRLVRVTNYSDMDDARAAAERLAEERGQAMSEESATPDPVELVRGSAEAANRGDVDGLMAFYAPDALMDGTRTILDLRRGRAAIRGLVEDWMAAYQELEWAVEEPVDLGNGVVFTVVSQKGRPVGVDGLLRQREGWVWVWVDGLIASLTFYPEGHIGEARAAAERLAEERG